jgi:hypothetical protein
MAVSEHDRETTSISGRGFSTTQSNKQLNQKGKCTHESSNVHTTLILLRERKYMQQIYKKSKSTQQSISIAGWRFQQRSDVQNKETKNYQRQPSPNHTIEKVLALSM